jgi:Flp pilus assembly protein TadD
MDRRLLAGPGRGRGRLRSTGPARYTMPASSTATPARRLERLHRYLQEDPANPALLADAFETALACGEQAQAGAYLDQARAQGLHGDHWTSRRARLCIACKDLRGASALLEQLRSSSGDHPAWIHDLGYVRLLEEDFAGCRTLLQPWVVPAAEHTPAIAAESRAALQVLWLRCLHRLHALDEAWEWVEGQQATGGLHAAAAGVASLIALDRNDFTAARSLSEAALAHDEQQPEALVARGSVALALNDTGQGLQLLCRALERSPDDGRIWSALGFASLQQGDLPLAQTRLERALRTLAGHIGTWHALGWARLMQSDQVGALAAFQQALALDRNFAESQGAVGLLLALTGETVRARHHLDLADRLDPKNMTGRYARALLAGEAGNLQRVSELAMRLLDRRGFFSGKLSDAFRAASMQPS